MANIYVRSTDGSDTDNGTTWALAKATIAGAAAIDSTTDRTIMVSQSHAETPSGATTWSFAGTKALPTVVMCVNDSAEPPTTSTTGATVVCDNALTIASSGGTLFAAFQGISFTAGSGGSTTLSIFARSVSGSHVTYDTCTFALASSGASSVINLGSGAGGALDGKDLSIKFSAAGQSIAVSAACAAHVDGLTLLSGGTSPTNLVNQISSGTTLTIERLDLTNAAAGINLTNVTTSGVKMVVRNGKLPDSWSGSYHTGTPGAGSRFSFYNVDSADTQDQLHIATPFGTIMQERAIVRSGKAISWKLVSNADSEWPGLALESDEIIVPVLSTGSKTITVHMITSGVTLTDEDIEMRVEYLGTSGRPLALVASTAPTNTLATATNLTSSSETWSTEPGSPVKQKVAVTFTAEEIGVAHVKLRLYRASSTVYVCPHAVLS